MDLKRFIAGKTLPGNEGKPICVIEPWSQGFRGGDNAAWDAWVRARSAKWRFWQIGHRFDSAVEGCEYYLWGAKGPRGDKKRLALIAEAQAFVGSSPALLAAARARGIPTHELKPASGARGGLDCPPADFLGG